MAILYFNPGHETAVQNASPYYMASANIVTMQKELSFLPAWYGKEEDVVLVDELEYSYDYYSFISTCFPFLPKPILENAISDYPQAEMLPWGISPQVTHYLKGICSPDNIIPVWKNEYTALHSRRMAKECLEKLVNQIPMISESIIPQFYTEMDCIENIVITSPYQLLAKAPYSSSGRGLLWLPATGLTQTERQILHGILKKQGCVSIEQVLDKDMDFAMEFMTDGRGNVRFEGYSLFHTNSKGAYLGNDLVSQNDIVSQLTCKIASDLLDEIKNRLTSILKDKYAPSYKGCIGIDMMVYKENGEYKVHPCLEINMRYNMGYLAMKLYENYIHPSSSGQFKIDFSAKEGVIFNNHMRMRKKYPIRLYEGKLMKGYLPLCPVKKDSKYWAYILVGN